MKIKELKELINKIPEQHDDENIDMSSELSYFYELGKRFGFQASSVIRAFGSPTSIQNNGGYWTIITPDMDLNEDGERFIERLLERNYQPVEPDSFVCAESDEELDKNDVHEITEKHGSFVVYAYKYLGKYRTKIDKTNKLKLTEIKKGKK